jgi:hypothetical protein
MLRSCGKINRIGLIIIVSIRGDYAAQPVVVLIGDVGDIGAASERGGGSSTGRV